MGSGRVCHDLTLVSGRMDNSFQALIWSTSGIPDKRLGFFSFNEWYINLFIFVKIFIFFLVKFLFFWQTIFWQIIWCRMARPVLSLVSEKWKRKVSPKSVHSVLIVNADKQHSFCELYSIYSTVYRMTWWTSQLLLIEYLSLANPINMNVFESLA